KVVLSGLCLACMTAIAWRARRTRPWVFVGWLWYLVALPPGPRARGRAGGGRSLHVYSRSRSLAHGRVERGGVGPQAALGPRAHANLGVALEASGDAAAALAAFQRALALDDRDAATHVRAADLLAGEGRVGARAYPRRSSTTTWAFSWP